MRFYVCPTHGTISEHRTATGTHDQMPYCKDCGKDVDPAETYMRSSVPEPDNSDAT